MKDMSTYDSPKGTTQDFSHLEELGREVVADGRRDDRAPLDVAFLRRELVERGPFASLDVVPETGSTNTDLMALAKEGAPAWTVLMSEHQVSGKGRMGRTFNAPPGAQLILSLLVRPAPSMLDHVGLLSMAAGLALVDAIGHDQQVRLKWPNDLIRDGKKLCGILAEGVDLDKDPGIIIGIGLNTSLRAEELPVPHASSLEMENIPYERNVLAVAELKALHARITQWETDPAGMMADYVAVCASIGQDVRVILPGDKELLGTVRTVLPTGEIVVTDDHGTDHTLAVGDVIHLRQRIPWSY